VKLNKSVDHNSVRQRKPRNAPAVALQSAEDVATKRTFIKLPAVAFVALQEKYGTVKAAEMLGISHSNFTPAALEGGEINSTHELAARYFMEQVDSPALLLVTCSQENVGQLTKVVAVFGATVVSIK
jgi:hypothetical protein